MGEEDGDVGDSVSEEHTPSTLTQSDPKTDVILELVGSASNILLIGPLMTEGDREVCTRFTTSNRDGTDTNLLIVTLTRSPDEWLEILHRHLDTMPSQITILSIGDTTRSAGMETVSVGETGSVTIETLADPTDHTQIGITISKHLSDWQNDPGQTRLCFHSLTESLRFIDDPKVLFQFLHILQGQVRNAGATAHYHMDTDAHDDQLIATFRPVFDEVIRFTEDGSLSISRE